VLNQNQQEVESLGRKRNDLTFAQQSPLLKIRAEGTEFVEVLCSRRDRPR